MRVAYLDAFSGLSGDMTVGALLDCGLELAALERALATLGVGGYHLRLERRERSGIQAAKFVVEIEGAARNRVPGRRAKRGPDDAPHSRDEHAHGAHHEHGPDDRAHRGHAGGTAPAHAGGSAHGHRSFRDIRELLRSSTLAPRVCELALEVFAELAAAEGKVHGMEPEDVTFHEVGAIDSIVDIVGAAWGIDALGIDELLVSPLPLGRGMVQAAHGPLPIPGPATVELLKGFPVRIGDGEGEMVTPTGAAIVAALAKPASAPPVMAVEHIGYGAGDRELGDRPNVLRVIVGTTASALGADSLLLLEANLDDLVPELYGYVMDRLFAAGARDVFLTAVQMKKNRPGTLLTVLADPGKRDELAAILFSETTTLGVRVQPVERLRVERESRAVETRFGRVRVKIGRGPDGSANVAPEYEDCRRAAEAARVPLKVVYQEAVAAAMRRG